MLLCLWSVKTKYHMPQYTLELVTPPSTEPVTTAELKTHLQLNTTAEDTLLSDFITTARVTFETMTRRPVIATTYRQWFYRFPSFIPIIRGAVSSVTYVKYYDTNGTLQTVDASTYATDLTGLVPSVTMLNGTPSTSMNKVPVGYVQFVAGWANAGAVDPSVKVAIKILAGHYFKNREAYAEKSLSELPMGFRSICSIWTTGLISYEVTQ